MSNPPRTIAYAVEYAAEWASNELLVSYVLVSDFDDTETGVVIRLAVLSTEEADTLWEIESEYYGEHDKLDEPLTIDMWSEYWREENGPLPLIIKLFADQNDYLPEPDDDASAWLRKFTIRYNLAIKHLSQLENL